MRQIILDTETTGLTVEDDHRIIEIGCIELRHRRVTEHRFHTYLNPEREVDAGAAAVHGMTRDKLRDAPRFGDVVEEFLAFVRGAELIIHNAAFDVGFLDRELARVGPAWGRLSDYCSVFDTLTLARELHPGQRNSLDALCKRYEVDNAHRSLHGALLDAELLAEVYLGLTGGQGALSFEGASAGARAAPSANLAAGLRVRPPGVRLTPSEADLTAHAARLAVIDQRSAGRCLWLAASTPA
ncbi:MAG: DNA polymerase III subunit epsilon [Gammaproteobacteria bacterium]|nr:DNA polymerase III subunit epsilon [Gammaproteobacteria bacterium]